MNQMQKPLLHINFKLASNRAIAQNENTFLVGDQTYSIRDDEGQFTILDGAGVEFAEVSDIIVNPLDQALFLTVDFKAAVRQAITDRETKFSYTDEGGETVDYRIVRVNNTYQY